MPMPVIKAQVIANLNRKDKKQVNDGSHSESEGASKKDDVELLRMLRGELKTLRTSIKKDFECVLWDCNVLQLSQGSEQFGCTSQVDCPARGMQDIYAPPRCSSAPARRKHTRNYSEFSKADSNLSLAKPAMDSSQDGLQEDLLNDSPAKAKENTSQSLPMAWQQPSTHSPKPPVTGAAYLPGQMDTCSSEDGEIDNGQLKHRGPRKLQFDDHTADFILESVIADVQHTRLQRIVLHDYFDYIMGGLILTNSLVIGVQAHMQALEKGIDNNSAFWQAVDITFSAIFLSELIIRIVAFKARFFFMEGWAWNIFDTVCVIFSVLDEMTELLLSGTAAKKAIDRLSILRVLRLFRLLRLVRMVRFIPALKSMVYLIAASLQSFLWTMVLILGVMYILAVYLTEVSTTLVIQGKSIPGDEIQEYWGNLFISISTAFQAITGGDDWHNFVKVFEAADSEKYSENLVFFFIYISFASLVLMNLVTGVFVEGAQRIAEEEKKQELQKQVRKIVREGRIDVNAKITWHAFTEQLATKDMGVYLKAFQMNRSQAADIFYILDDNRLGTICMKDFFSACIQLHGSVKLSDTEILRHRMMHSIGDINERLDAMEARQERMLLAVRRSSKGPTSGLTGRGQSPLPRPHSASISGYVTKTGSKAHLGRRLSPSREV